ncbi:hypothetical protein AB835_09150 [Candidatus Endobugula sertula]|uniref:Sulfotransferase n=1 Tax=Candidatus Endobugula sertula TaxID=62101 RepID=A0A1D2QP63_9GAMM|nr:hypothetical protein AB835_09150 [Candidatus Endobugula sertula]
MNTQKTILNRPLIVVGAGRSGTTMIREALTQHKDIGGFHYEMNYLWRYGNTSLKHDLLQPDLHLTPKITRYIRKIFAEESVKQGKSRVLDKTVANVMRLNYIQEVLPEAKFLHVIRDGRAVTASAIKQWSAPQSGNYYASKAKTIPLSSLPRVATRYAYNKLISYFRQRNYRQSWGPRWVGIDKAVRDLPLIQVCARQWKESVSTALAQKDMLQPNAYLEVRYEQLVQDPNNQFKRIQDFFELGEDNVFEEWISTQIDSNRQDKWQKDLSKNDLALIEDEISPLLRELGYQ